MSRAFGVRQRRRSRVGRAAGGSEHGKWTAKSSVFYSITAEPCSSAASSRAPSPLSFTSIHSIHHPHFALLQSHPTPILFHPNLYDNGPTTRRRPLQYTITHLPLAAPPPSLVLHRCQSAHHPHSAAPHTDRPLRRPRPRAAIHTFTRLTPLTPTRPWLAADLPLWPRHLQLASLIISFARYP
jgi:hypothetical protein